MGNDLEQEDEIIELTQVVDDDFLNVSEQDVQGQDALDHDALDHDTLDHDTLDQEIIELTDIHTNTDEVQADEVQAEEPDDNDLDMESVLMGDSSISQEQVDAALERVIEKKFAEKIEKILFEVMERVIEKEVVDLKARLQKDLDEIGNT